MSFNIKGLGGTVASAVTSLTQQAGTFGSELSKMKGESDVLQMLEKSMAAPAQGAAGSESTQEGGKSYAEEAVSKTLNDNKLYLGTLLGSDANKVMEKIQTKVADFMKANPNASKEQVDKAVKDSFNNESLGAKIFKDVIDKMLQETMSRIREAAE